MKDIISVMIPEDELQKRIAELGAEITKAACFLPARLRNRLNSR